MPAPRQSMWLYFFQMPSHHKVSVCVLVTLDAESASSNFSSLFELACSLACGTLLKNKNIYLFFHRRQYEHIEETWDFYESYPVVPSFFFFFNYLLFVIQWPLQNRENCLGCVKIQAQELDLSFILLEEFAVVRQMTRNTKISVNNALVQEITTEQLQIRLQGIWKEVISRLSLSINIRLWFLLPNKDILPQTLCPTVTLEVQ